MKKKKEALMKTRKLVRYTKFFITYLFAMFAFHSQSFAESAVSCFNLYMRVNANDPGQFCLQYPEQIAVGDSVGVALYGFTNTNKYLIETFTAKIGPSDTINYGRFGLWTTFTISGHEQLYSAYLKQFAGSNPPLFATVVIKNLRDGHLQTEIVDYSGGGSMGNPNCRHCK